MLSTCPSCLNQILHDDSVNQLQCGCGEAFSPFLSETPGVDFNSSPMMAMAEKSAVHPIMDSQLEDAPFAGTSLNEAAAPTDYSESEAAFAELRNFGEGLGSLESVASSETNPPVATPLAPPQAQAAKTPTPTNATPTANISNDCCITAGDSLEGYEIESFLPPLSVWCQSSTEADDPLKQAHEILAQRASSLGASGVVSVRWSFTPDGSRILLTGTPVKCRKKG